MDRRRSNTAGMTLLELMFAAGIVAVVLAMVFGSLITVSAIGTINESRVEAVAALSGIMEEINTLPYDQVLEYMPPELEMPGRYYQISVELILPEGGEGLGEPGGKTIFLPLPPEYDAPLPNPVQVRVTLAWLAESGHDFRVEATTVKGR